MFIKYPHRIYYMSLLSNMTTFKDKLIFGARNTYIHVFVKTGNTHKYLFLQHLLWPWKSRQSSFEPQFLLVCPNLTENFSRNNNFGSVMRNFSRETFEKRKGLKKCNWCRTARNLKVCAKTKKKDFSSNHKRDFISCT